MVDMQPQTQTKVTYAKSAESERERETAPNNNNPIWDLYYELRTARLNFAPLHAMDCCVLR